MTSYEYKDCPSEDPDNLAGAELDYLYEQWSTLPQRLEEASWLLKEALEEIVTSRKRIIELEMQVYRSPK